MAERLSDLADALWPHLARRVAQATGGAAALNVASPTDHGALTGLLDDDHPQYLTAGRGDGRYPALADWTTHIGNADAHHARLHVLATNAGLGADHTISGATAGHVLRASSATAAAFAQLAHSDLSGIGTNTHATIDTHIANSDIHVAHSGVSMSAGDGLTGGGTIAATRSFAVSLSATSGLELTGTSPNKTLQIADSIAGAGLAANNKVLSVGVANTGATGLTVEADAVRLTSSNNPGAAASILASDATGKLTLPLMVATTGLTTPLVAAGAGQSLTLQPPLDLILDPTSDLVRMGSGASLQASSYASQTTGWRITDAGEADFRYMFVDEMHAKSFIADLEQALAGGQIIAKSVAMVATAFTLPAAGAAGTLRVKDLPSAPNMAVFQSGDFVGLRLFSRAAGSLTIGWAWGTVTSYADGTGGNEGTQTWTFTRHATTPGAATGTIPADALALDFGVSGNGFYEVNAIDGAYGANSPYAQVVTWATHPATQTVRTRMGNLRGIFSVADEFGLYAGSGTAVTDRYIRASSAAFELRNIPLALFDGSNNTMLLSAGASNNSPFLAMGSPLPTGPLVNDGIWAGKDGSVYELRVGTVSGGALVKGLHWDGANLVWKATNTSLDASGNLIATNATLSGQITADLGAIGGWTIAESGLTATNIGLYSGAANTARLQVGTGSNVAGVNSVAAASDIAFWAGDTHANRTAAEFRVRADGQLYATGATLSGAITATSGTITGDFSVTGGGKLSAGDGEVVFDVNGQAIGLYPDVNGGVIPAGVAKSISWYDTPSTRTGLQARQYVGKASDSTPHWNVTVNPGGSSPLTMTLWWGGATLNDLRFTNLAQVTGLPALFLSGGITPTAQVQSGSRLQLNSGSEFLASTHLKAGTTNTYDLGEAGVKWRKLYVGEVVADTVSGGTALGGNTWQRADAGDMYIYSFSEANNRTLYVANPGAGTMSLDVEGNIALGGNITVSGTVDGVDLSAFKTAYDSHNHDGRYYTETELQTSGSASVHWGNITNTPATYAPSSHALTAHTASGLTVGHVIRASGATTFAWAQLAHSDLSGVGTNSHATIDTHIAATAAHGATGAVVGTTNTQTLTNKTLTTPTIASFTNAQHAHTDAASGGTIAHGSLTGVGANDHHSQSHVLASTSGLGADHTVSGLTARQVLRATGATTAAFGAIEDADLPSTIVRTSRQVIAGNGLTGGGALSADVTVTMGTPGTLTASTTNAVTSTSHTHAITTSSDPQVSATILQTNASGVLTLQALAIRDGMYTNASAPRRYYEVVAYNSSGNPDTGTLKITLPKYRSTTMMAIRIVGFQYSAGTYGRGAWEALIGGYNNSTNGWVSSGGSAVVTGEAPFSSVRLCEDGVNDIILLGDTDSRWYYPKIVVSYMIAGSNNTTGWESGWSMSVISDETGITTKYTPPVYHAPPDYRTLTAGNGLTGGGDLTANRTIDIGNGDGIAVSADSIALSLSATSGLELAGTSPNKTLQIADTVAGNGLTITSKILALGTPSSLTATTTNAVTSTSHTHSITTGAAVGLSVSSTSAEGSGASIARADHTHAITTSSNPGAAASILASSAAGALTLVDMTVTSLSASRLVASDGSDKLVSTSLNSWIAGTANRVTVADDGDGTVTLSAPQDIHTAATPTFGGLIAPWLRPASDSTTALQLRNASGTAILTVDTTNSRVGIGVTPTSKLHVRGTPGSNTYLKIDTTTNASADKFIELVSGGNIASGSHWIYATDGLADGSDFIVRGDGAVAIGSLDPGSYKLHVSGTGKFTGSVDSDVQFLGQASDTVSAPSFSWTSDTNTGMWRPAADTLSITTGGTEVARFAVRDIAFFNSTLESWSTTYRGFQLGAYASIMVAPVFAPSYSSHLIYNAYYDTTSAWKYQNANPAVSYVQGSAGHTWRVAATGVADATLTWTDAMTLDLNSKLTVAGDLAAGGTIYADGGIVDFGTNYFQEGATYLELKGAKPFYLNQTIQASGWSMSAGGALVSSSSLSAASLALTGAATITGDLTVGGTVLQVNSAGTRIGINRVADQQFDLDIAGAARAQYWIGPHALQLKNAAAIIQFDGPAPYALDYSGSSLTHMGVSPTTETAVIYRPGRFGKAAQLAAGTTNYCRNPSFETELPAIDAEWTVYSTTLVAQATDAYIGSYSLSVTTAGTSNPYLYASNAPVTLATGQTWTFSAYVKAGNDAAVGNSVTVSLRENEDSGYLSSVSVILSAEWQRISVTRTLTHATPTALNRWVTHNSAGNSGEIILIDAVQLEQQVHASPYCDGSLGSGHAWTGTEHASTSTRASSNLTYSKLVNPAAYTVGGWFKVTLAENTTISGLFRPRFIQIGAYANASSATVGVNSTSTAIQLYTQSVASAPSWAISGILAANANYEPGEWVFIALSYNGSVHKVYVGREAAGDAGWFEYTSTAIPDHYSLAERLSLSWTAGTGLDLVDGVFVLDEAADAKLIRSIYESNAPVFAESSVVSFRAPTKSQIWVDEFGFWAKGQSGGEAFGIFGGDPRRLTTTKSWGGVTMEENDIVIGRTSAPSYTALHWDDSAGELILGRQAAEHLSLVSGAVRIKNATTVYADLTGGTLTLGSSTAEHVLVNTSGVALKDSTTVYAQFAATTTIGVTTTDHISVSSTSIQLKDGSSVYTDLTSGTLTLGLATTENVRITSTALEFRNSSTVIGSLDGTTWTLGKTGTGENNVQITPTTLSLRSGTNKHAELTSAGVLTLGLTSSGDYITIDGTNGVRLYGNSSLLGQWTAAGGVVIGAVANSTSRIEITSGAVNIINRSAGGADTTAISLSSSGNASFTGSITATSGTVGGWTIGTTLSATNLILTPGAANTAHILAGTGATAGGINSAAASGDVVFWAGSTFANRATANFTVTAGGSITAKAGTVGGWALGTDDLTGGNVYLHDTGYIRIGAASADRLWLSATDATYRLWVGHDTAASAPVRIQKTGAFHFGTATRYLSFDGTDIAWAGVSTSLTTGGLFTAANASITGTIDANAGFLGALTIDGVLSIASGGEIRQGSGTLGSNYTGLRVWHDGGIGRIGSYNTDTLQWYAGTDGKLYAGGGNTILDANGVNVVSSTSTFEQSKAYTFSHSGVIIGGLASVRDANTTTLLLKSNSVADDTANNAAENGRNGAVSISGIGQGTGKAGVVLLTAQMYTAREYPASLYLYTPYSGDILANLTADKINLYGEAYLHDGARIGADPGGAASTLTLTNATGAAGGAGTGTVKMNDGTNRNNNGFIKMYVGTTAVYIPYWTTIAG
jgi:hypothetical protein